MTDDTVFLFASPAALTAAMPARAETRIEVLHHWVSESEVAALNTIRTALAARGYGWQDSAVGGMSGGNMQQALRSPAVLARFEALSLEPLCHSPCTRPAAKAMPVTKCTIQPTAVSCGRGAAAAMGAWAQRPWGIYATQRHSKA